ncbi:glucose dehydrogenase [FAD, quinone]-like [Copidosoma floridanum]|uniref:glucose dehydrogenase [FAD, quinone]-like n=1 Tax=Copidosoma floridanum TaxID=29053 RepID=UPI0006C98A90|nr:glucose dehydrogenase [FAD, quinone]-like [Copidosoma floridanum]
MKRPEMITGRRDALNHILRSKDPSAKPKIFVNYLDDPEDVRVMIEGIRAPIKVAKTKAMQRFKSKFYYFAVPGCEEYEDDSTEYWECAVRTFTFTIYHYTGTCKMAPETDSTGVVNPRLQVKGVGRLRVADASIMPVIVTGHTNIPTVMIEEKVSDMIKEDWNLGAKEARS